MQLLGGHFLTGVTLPPSSKFMLDLYRTVSLVPEQEAALCSGMSPAALDNDDEGEASTGLNLGSLLLPCITMLDTHHLAADIRLASPQQTEWRQTFSKQVSEPSKSSESFLRGHPTWDEAAFTQGG